MQIQALDCDYLFEILGEFSYVEAVAIDSVYCNGDERPAVRVTLAESLPPREAVCRELTDIVERAKKPGHQSADVVLVEADEATVYLLLVERSSGGDDSFTPSNFRVS